MAEEMRFYFDTGSDGELTLEGAVFQALGAASTCWDNVEAAGRFHDEWAKVIGEALLEFVRERGAS